MYRVSAHLPFRCLSTGQISQGSCCAWKRGPSLPLLVSPDSSHHNHRQRPPKVAAPPAGRKVAVQSRTQALGQHPSGMIWLPVGMSILSGAAPEMPMACCGLRLPEVPTAPAPQGPKPPMRELLPLGLKILSPSQSSFKNANFFWIKTH